MSQELIGDSISGAMRCVMCRHKISAATHEHCRTHALCARGARYWSRYCHVCGELWERSRNLLRYPEDSLTAWCLLKDWIDGFIKNSRNRVKGQSVFISKRERVEYDDLNVILTNVAAIPSLDDHSSESCSAEVSFVTFL